MDTKGPVNREELVKSVVDCFLFMGATDEAAAVERDRLSTDDAYLEEWLKAISPEFKDLQEIPKETAVPVR
jgi:hypothetical protein